VTLTAKDVAEITRLLEESSFDELYLELDGVKLSLRRGISAGRVPSAASVPHGSAGQPPEAAASASTAAPAVVTGQSATQSPVTTAAHGTGGVEPGLHNVSSPLLGTFYRAPKPGAPPYVEVGSVVEADTIVGIIEVMKLMNTVRAGAPGRVLEILARDGALVEYGETLVRIGKPG
jgi:acetyl-CoA carboxylase biotin carboxyl carrier protein